MGLASRLKDLAVKLERANNSIFSHPVEKQKEYLAHFPEPSDDIERAYFQYRCQMKFNNPLISFALNAASFPMLFLYKKKAGTKPERVNGIDTVFFADGKPANIIPTILQEQSGNIVVVVGDKKEYLTEEGRAFYKILRRRYPFSFQFLLKCLMKIRFYDYEIEHFHPQQIIVCNEYSFTCSAMTAYCQKRGIKHTNVMHGEKLFFMRDSFFRFHECYVWDVFYKELFIKLRAEKSQFKVAVPPSLLFDENCSLKEFDYTYYLGAEKDEKLRAIVYAMYDLSKAGYKVAIRPHPRYSDLAEIKRAAPTITVENVNELSIERSVLRTKNAVSVYSTVLNQASHNGVPIVMDDVSDQDKFAKLRERQYIMLSKPHRLLSELLEEKQ